MACSNSQVFTSERNFVPDEYDIVAAPNGLQQLSASVLLVFLTHQSMVTTFTRSMLRTKIAFAVEKSVCLTVCHDPA